MDPLWSETRWSALKYFIILIVSTYYILCISWIIKCLSLTHGANMKIYFCVWLKPETKLFSFSIILYFNCFIFVGFWILICGDSNSLFYSVRRIGLSTWDVFAWFVTSAVHSGWNYVPMKKEWIHLYICRVVDQIYVCLTPRNNWCLWKAYLCIGLVSTFLQLVYNFLILIHFTEWKPVVLKPRGRPKIRKEDEVKREVKVLTICHWKMQDKTRNEWKSIMEQAESSSRRLQRRTRKRILIH